MRRRAGAAPAAALLAVAVTGAVHAAGARPYRDGPPPGHTGGFGEPHCGACHFDAPVNPPEGRIRVSAPERYEPGGCYQVVVELSHPALAAGGFQLSARFATGDAAGAGAGSLEPGEDARVQIVQTPSGLQYATHTAAGAAAAAPSLARWTLSWTAPPGARGPVVFHVAANAADDDGSELGDRIFTAAARSEPVESRIGSDVPTDCWLPSGTPLMFRKSSLQRLP